eukprot:m.20334 g.20334  ORF g.20334 m.20334 type:complete len:61 (+) comp5241_c0_seq1:547-729(+)
MLTFLPLEKEYVRPFHRSSLFLFYFLLFLLFFITFSFLFEFVVLSQVERHSPRSCFIFVI